MTGKRFFRGGATGVAADAGAERLRLNVSAAPTDKSPANAKPHGAGCSRARSTHGVVRAISEASLHAAKR
jgi:hypothetical protein